MSKIRTSLLICCVLSVGAPAFGNPPMGGGIGGPGPAMMGGNLTGFQGNTGAMNNNAWNQAMNPGKGSAGATADFGNCNSLILRCAQPKCASGGCTEMSVAAAIVNGCVQANPSCKQYGDDLVGAIAAQIVANSNAKQMEAQNAAQAQAAAQMAAQSNAQVEQMASQMEQMQQQMAQRDAEAAARLDQALEEQRRMAEESQAAADARAREAEEKAAASSVAGITTNVGAAAAAGVSADTLVRDQIAGRILSKIEDADAQMRELKKTMQDTFDYAGCDTHGNNCQGVKRVAAFKNKAQKFLDPYNNVLDEVYDALIQAQALGVDITDIYMMLNDSCNVWGKYMCQEGQNLRFASCPDTCFASNGDKVNQGETVPGQTTACNCACGGGWIDSTKKRTDGKTPHQYMQPSCPTNRAQNGKVATPAENGCMLIETLTDNATVQQEWLYGDANNEGVQVMVACASDALDNSKFFRSRKKQTSIDIELLEMMIMADGPSFGDKGSAGDSFKFCNVRNTDDLEAYVMKKSLPKKLCVGRKSNYVEEKVFEGITSNKLTSAQVNLQRVYFDQCDEYCKQDGNHKNCNAENQKRCEINCKDRFNVKEGAEHTVFDKNYLCGGGGGVMGPLPESQQKAPLDLKNLPSDYLEKLKF